MKIKMLQNQKASDVSGLGVALPVKLYEKGKEYEVSEELSGLFLKSGACEKVENKSMGSALENKMQPVHENKATKKKAKKKVK